MEVFWGSLRYYDPILRFHKLKILVLDFFHYVAKGDESCVDLVGVYYASLKIMLSKDLKTLAHKSAY
jgi:hypothetical protein